MKETNNENSRFETFHKASVGGATSIRTCCRTLYYSLKHLDVLDQFRTVRENSDEVETALKAVGFDRGDVTKQPEEGWWLPTAKLLFEMNAVIQGISHNASGLVAVNGEPVMVGGPVPNFAEYLNRIEYAALRLDDGQSQSQQTHRRLIVDIATRTVSLDGQEWDVRSVNALRWVQILADRPKEWITSSDLEKLDNELINIRTDRLKKYLPEPIRDLIEAKTGAGSRLML